MNHQNLGKMEQIKKILIENNNKGGKTKINEGQEKGNNRNVTTQRPNVQPAPQKPTQTDKK